MNSITTANLSDQEIKAKFIDLQVALHRKLLNINALVRICSKQTGLSLLSKENLPTYKQLRKDVDKALSKAKTCVDQFDKFDKEELIQTYNTLITLYKNS